MQNLLLITLEQVWVWVTSGDQLFLYLIPSDKGNTEREKEREKKRKLRGQLIHIFDGTVDSDLQWSRCLWFPSGVRVAYI